MKTIATKIQTLKSKIKDSRIAKYFKDMDAKIDDFNEGIIDKFKNLFDKYKLFIFMFIILCFAMGIRYALARYPSNDFLSFIQNWTYDIKVDGGGFIGLKNLYEEPLKNLYVEGLNKYVNVPNCDYPPLYMYAIAIISSFPLGNAIGGISGGALYFSNVMYLVKTFSFIFDLLIAIFTYKIVKEVSKSSVNGAIAFSIVLFLPTAVINSGLWGQCDTCYTAMCVISTYYIIKNKQIRSMIFFGLALSFKLQGIFILPLFGFMWFRKSFKLRYMLFVPLTVFLTFIPLYLVGASFTLPFQPFLRQATGYAGELNWNSTSIYTFFTLYTNSTTKEATNAIAAMFGMIMTVSVCFITIASLAFKRKKVDSKSIITIVTFFALVVPFFLPFMHERYFYMADVFVLIYALSIKKRFHLPVMMQFSSLIAYSVFGIITSKWLITDWGKDNLRIGTILNVVILIFLIYDMVHLEKEERIIENKTESINDEIMIK